MTVGNYSTCGALGEAKSQIAAAGLRWAASSRRKRRMTGRSRSNIRRPARRCRRARTSYLFVKSPSDSCP